jgi:hypothetical protein
LQRAPVEVAGIGGFPLLMDYVVLATGEEGTDAAKRTAVTAQVAADSIGAKALYRPIGRFGLPDGTEAVLLRVARKPVAALDPSPLAMQQLADPFVRRYLRPESGYALTVDQSDAAQARAGRFESLHLVAAAGALGDFAYRPEGVAVQGLDLELRGVQVNPAALARGTLQFVSVEEIRLSGLEIQARDIATYLAASSKGKLRVESLTMQNETLRIAVHQQPDRRIEAALQLAARADNLWFHCTSVRLGPVPLPATLVNVLGAAYNPLLPRPEGVGRLRLGELHLEVNRLRVEAPH